MNTLRASSPDSINYSRHDNALALEGLEDLFKWSSEMVATGEDSRAARAKEQRIRKQVLELVQQTRQDKAVKEANSEISYLQRRVIALLQSLQELTQENAALKQIMVAQHFALQRVPELENEIDRLKTVEFDRDCAQAERRELLTGLSRLKKDRDFLDDLLTAVELENNRLAVLLAETKTELAKLQSRRWWHWLIRK